MEWTHTNAGAFRTDDMLAILFPVSIRPFSNFLESDSLRFTQHMYFYEDYMEATAVTTNLNSNGNPDTASTPGRFVNAVAGPSRLM